VRLTLTRRELILIKSFIENVDQGTWIDQLTDKLERAIARIDEQKIPPRRKVPLDWRPDERRALCLACGWEGTLTKTNPCPTCRQKVNPLLFDGRKKTT
jgi:hypothetical protein